MALEKKVEEVINIEQYDTFFVDIYRCWKNCVAMLKDRGYTVPIEFENYRNNDFHVLYQNIDAESGFNNYDIFGVHKNGNKILVKFLVDIESVKGDRIKGVRNDVNISKKYGEDTKIIFIFKNKPNQSVLKEIKNGDEIFYYNELVVQRVKHRLVPKHTLLTEADKKELNHTYDVKDTQLPRILTTDFVTRYYGAKPGDIFKIERPSPSTGITVAYRIVK